MGADAPYPILRNVPPPPRGVPVTVSGKFLKKMMADCYDPENLDIFSRYSYFQMRVMTGFLTGPGGNTVENTLMFFRNN
jgi:hypothetical protein